MKFGEKLIATEGDEWIRKAVRVAAVPDMWRSPWISSGKSEGIAFIRVKCPACAGSGRKNF
jgi:hypothetical protein